MTKEGKDTRNDKVMKYQIRLSCQRPKVEEDTLTSFSTSSCHTQRTRSRGPHGADGLQSENVMVQRFTATNIDFKECIYCCVGLGSRLCASVIRGAEITDTLI